MLFLEDIVCPLKTVFALQMKFRFQLPEAKFWWVQYIETSQYDIFAAPTVEGMRDVEPKTIEILGPAYLAEELGFVMRGSSLPEWNGTAWSIRGVDGLPYNIDNPDLETPKNEADARGQLLFYMLESEQMKVDEAHKIPDEVQE